MVKVWKNFIVEDCEETKKGWFAVMDATKDGSCEREDLTAMFIKFGWFDEYCMDLIKRLDSNEACFDGFGRVLKVA